MAVAQKTQQIITVVSFFPAKQQSWGMSQGAKIQTDKGGPFQCFNEGPTWFGDQHKNKQVSVMGSWKQWFNQKTGVNEWQMSCSFQEAGGAGQGESSPGPGSPTSSTAAPYDMPAPIQDDMQIEDIPGKCRCLVIAAAVQSGQIKCETPAKASKLVEYIVTGKYPRAATAGPDGADYPQEEPPATTYGAPTELPTGTDTGGDDTIPF